MKEVSIIIPIFNVEKYVAECLNSVISQTYAHSKIECIIVNDCTPDCSMDIVNEIISRYNGDMTFIIHNHNHNQGLSAARNTGIDFATGQYIYFLDSDDYIYPNTIETLLSATENNTIDLVIGNYYKEFDKKNAFEINNIHVLYKIDRIFFGKMRKFNVWNYLIKKHLLEMSRAKFPIGRYFEDVIFNVQLCTFIDKATVVPVSTYFYRNNPNGIIRKFSKVNITKSISDYLYILDFIIDNLDKKICVGKNAIAVRTIFYINDMMKYTNFTLDKTNEIKKRMTYISLSLIKYNIRHLRLFLLFHSLLSLRPIVYLFIKSRLLRNNCERVFNFLLYPALWADTFHK